MSKDGDDTEFVLRGGGMELTYRPSAATLDVGDEGGVRTYTGEQITTANDEFAMPVTVCTLVSDRAGFGRFLTLALPRGPASPEDDTVQGILISTRRQDLHGSMTIRSQEVQSVSGTARPVLP
jgi:hypothetical protein